MQKVKGHRTNRLNGVLASRYKAAPSEEVFVSGDFTTYIQRFGDSMGCCGAKYVPDRFHVCKALRDSLPDVCADDVSLNDPEFREYLIGALGGKEDANAKKPERHPDREPKLVRIPLYLGCSQEGQNSHIYAPRFGKYGNRFSPSTIEKLSLIREAKAMGAEAVAVHAKREIPQPILKIMPREEAIRYDLDTREMKYETAKMFNRIKYGGLY